MPQHEPAEYALGAFLARWYPTTAHDLAASESETWTAPQLLAMADDTDRRRWNNLDLGYTDPRGADWLRLRIAEGYDSIDANGIVCFAGAQEALTLALRALVGPGDHAIMVLPAYQPSEIALTGLCETTGIALAPHAGWALDLDRVAKAIRPNTRLMLVNFPNNPTGRIIARPDFTALIELCRRHGLWLVNDEVYRHIDRDPTHRLPCLADSYERGVSIDALSKGFGLPGLRVGWMASGDPQLLQRARDIKQIASLCLSAPSEVLAHIALGNRVALLSRNHAIAKANLVLLQNLIDRHGDLFDWHVPEGGVVGYIGYRGADGVEAFAARLASEAATLVLPASVWRSALADTDLTHFRIGFGRRGCSHGIDAMERFIAGRSRHTLARSAA